MGYPILEDGSLDYDQPTPAPQRIWHVDGILAPFDKSTTLDGSRVTYAATETAAAEKVLTACRSVRGGDWGWLGVVCVYPHYAWTDPDCPVCKRRANKKYPKAIDTLYEPVIITPQRLTDPAQGYGEPSEAAMEMAKRYISLYTDSDTDMPMAWGTFGLYSDYPLPDIEEVYKSKVVDMAQALDAFATQAVAALRAKAQSYLDKCKENAATAPDGTDRLEWEDNAYSWQRFITVMFDKP